MTWTTVKPSLVGWYWVRNTLDVFPGHDLTPTIAKIFEITSYDDKKNRNGTPKEKFIQFFGNESAERWKEVQGDILEWLGPIESEGG